MTRTGRTYPVWSELGDLVGAVLDVLNVAGTFWTSTPAPRSSFTVSTTATPVVIGVVLVAAGVGLLFERPPSTVGSAVLIGLGPALASVGIWWRRR